MSEVDTDVIIIGAGIAGLNAASTLHSKGLKSLILEARPRIGGRVYTKRDTVTGNHYDLGASWFHSTMENPIFDKFTNNWYSNSQIESAKYDDNNVGIIINSETGSLPSGINVGAIVDEMKYYSSNLKDDISLHNCAIEYFKTKQHRLSRDEIKYSTALFKFAELINGCDWDSIGSKFSYGPFNGRDAFNTIGYDKVIEKIIEGYPNDNILLNKVVKSVEKIQVGKADETIIKVTNADGSIYKSKYLIVTIPLGVLKLSIDKTSEEGAITFNPPLPKPITDNFAKTKFLPLVKVIVEFDKAFWPDNDKFLVLSVPKDDELDITKTYETIKEFGNYTDKEHVKAFDFPCLVSNFNSVRKIPALMFLLPSQPAYQIENASDPEKYGYDLIKPIISKIVGKDIEIPEPKLILTTSWGNDPYSRGAISTCAPGDKFVNDALIDGFGSIRFAGEGPIYQGHSCAHGAYISGEREANYIIEKLSK